jgi:hypothetical protein
MWSSWSLLVVALVLKEAQVLEAAARVVCLLVFLVL